MVYLHGVYLDMFVYLYEAALISCCVTQLPKDSGVTPLPRCGKKASPVFVRSAFGRSPSTVEFCQGNIVALLV